MSNNTAQEKKTRAQTKMADKMPASTDNKISRTNFGLSREHILNLDWICLQNPNKTKKQLFVRGHEVKMKIPLQRNLVINQQMAIGQKLWPKQPIGKRKNKFTVLGPDGRGFLFDPNRHKKKQHLGLGLLFL